MAKFRIKKPIINEETIEVEETQETQPKVDAPYSQEKYNQYLKSLPKGSDVMVYEKWVEWVQKMRTQQDSIRQTVETAKKETKVSYVKTTDNPEQLIREQSVEIFYLKEQLKKEQDDYRSLYQLYNEDATALTNLRLMPESLTDFSLQHCAAGWYMQVLVWKDSGSEAVAKTQEWKPLTGIKSTPQEAIAAAVESERFVQCLSQKIPEIPIEVSVNIESEQLIQKINEVQESLDNLLTVGDSKLEIPVNHRQITELVPVDKVLPSTPEEWETELDPLVGKPVTALGLYNASPLTGTYMGRVYKTAGRSSGLLFAIQRTSGKKAGELATVKPETVEVVS